MRGAFERRGLALAHSREPLPGPALQWDREDCPVRECTHRLRARMWTGGDCVALLIFPLGILMGWFVHPPHRAEVATYAAGFGAFMVVSLLWAFIGDFVVRPFDGFVLLFGTPLAGALASWVARWRLSRRAQRPG